MVPKLSLLCLSKQMKWPIKRWIQDLHIHLIVTHVKMTLDLVALQLINTTKSQYLDVDANIVRSKFYGWLPKTHYHKDRIAISRCKWPNNRPEKHTSWQTTRWISGDAVYFSVTLLLLIIGAEKQTASPEIHRVVCQPVCFSGLLLSHLHLDMAILSLW